MNKGVENLQYLESTFNVFCRFMTANTPVCDARANGSSSLCEFCLFFFIWNPNLDLGPTHLFFSSQFPTFVSFFFFLFFTFM